MSLAWPDREALAKRVARAPRRFQAYLERRAEQADEAWIARNVTRIDEYLDRSARIDLRYRWSEACRRVGLGQQITTPLGGTATGKIPRPVSVTLGPPDRLVIEMPSGVIVDDLEHFGPELSEALGVWRLRFTEITPPYVRVDLIESDPLEAVIPYLPPHPLGHLVIGVDEDARVVSTPLGSLTSVVCQGPTRQGKSAWLYSLVAQLAEFEATGLVDVVGIDPVGSILRPWGRHPRGWRQWGAQNAVERYTAVVDGLIAEMERRIGSMPVRSDVVPIGPDTPMIVCVLEEWPAIGRLTGHKRQSPGPVHKGVSRILAEGMKAQIRVVMAAQRADGDAGGIGPFERDQCLTRLTFGAADAGTVKMLHEVEVPDDVIAAQAVAPPGCALLTAPGVRLARVRGPWLGDYAAYADAVSDHSEAA